MNSIDFTQIHLDKIITHHIGNRLRDENFKLSNEESIIEDETKRYLLKYFLSSIKIDEFNCFYHTVDLSMNGVYTLVKDIFLNSESFVLNSKSLAKLLYEESMHPKIKEGQLNVVLFNNVVINNEITTAVGLFKSETSLPFIQMKSLNAKFNIFHSFGFDLKQMDKGCLIFNIEENNGYKVCIVDSNKSNDTQYWKENFLNIRPASDNYHFTKDFLSITKNFVTNQLINDFEVSKAEQIDLLNRSVDYFKKRESFDKQEFEKEVFADSNIIDSFRKFDQTYREENEVDLSDNFEISAQAVKKQARVFKSVLKLDKNFHIYIHGDKELIEQGVDENGRKFYKIYYDEES